MSTNPYRVVEDGLGTHVIRRYEDGEELYWAEVETAEEGATIAAAEWDRERAGGVIP